MIIPLPKHASHDQFSPEMLQQQLQNLGSSSDITASQWVFDGTTLNFSALMHLEQNNQHWCAQLGMSPTWLARLLLLEQCRGLRSSVSIRSAFYTIAKWLFWLFEQYNTGQHIGREQRSLVITQNDLPELFGYLVMHTLSAEGAPERRLTPCCFNLVEQYFAIRDWRRTLAQLGLKSIGFTSAFSKNVQTKHWKEVIEHVSGGELSYADWKSGGSFNYLTLDYGRHYIEHCTTFFSQHISMATALKLTLESVDTIINLSGVHRFACTQSIHHFLQGKDVTQLPRSITHSNTSGRRRVSDSNLLKIQQTTQTIYDRHLRPLRASEAMLSDSEIAAMAKHFHLDDTSLNEQDWLRQIVMVFLCKFDPEHNVCSDETITLYDKWLSEIVEPRLGGLKKLEDWLIYRWKAQHDEVDTALPTEEWFRYLGLVRREGATSTYLHEFIARVADAGLTQVVALNGWRESEYGWSLQDIHITRNRDALDQHAMPFRYSVKWVVPKTHGEAKLNREITQSTYLAAQQLAKLVVASPSCPALYPSHNLKAAEKSTQTVKYRVSNLWRHFVDYYPPFVQLDKAQALDKLREQAKSQVLTCEEQQQLSQLSEENEREEWTRLLDDRLLIEAHRRARAERERVIFFFETNSRQKLLERYCCGELPDSMQQLLDKHLCDATKEDIQSRAASLDFPASYTKVVVNEVMEGCLYPTPHALRHIWAEAVYRRFDGDVGWMIRSQFKHVSQSMWLAYIRNKDNRRQHDTVKRRAINSLLSNYMKKKGKGFAGKLNTLLRRAFAKTQVVNTEKIDGLVAQFAEQEIKDIKSNPWGFCILLKRNQHRAKCAVGGAPQRQNACAGLCLDCVNNLSQEGNVQGILLAIGNDIKLLETPGVPAAWREPALATVKNALKHLKKLSVNEQIIDALQASLNTKEHAA
ncbi:hypothetical protein NB663_07290 [Vibrio parahaemolyticus]|uniref:hypothetical protein n=1 Tax=Vibrio parahaemolyticus TaxID=670 RepID=UPI00215D26EB|nr:hypothetical protein [Vibrio parahaemolyticus]MCR9780337.1 hypothetical protein [Vibrio parahaemolyticus]